MCDQRLRDAECNIVDCETVEDEETKKWCIQDKEFYEECTSGGLDEEEAEIEDWIPYFDCLWENACDCRQRDANGELVDCSTLEGEAQERCQTAQEDFEGYVLGDSCEGIIYFDDIGCDYVLMKDDEGNAIDCTTLPEGEQKASCEQHLIWYEECESGAWDEEESTNDSEK